MIKTFANEKGKTFIGRLGENDHRQIVFDESREILKMYPEAVVSVLHQRPSDPDAYPVAPEFITIEDGMVCWTIQSGDVAEKGNGLCEVVFIQGSTVAKTLRYHTQILDALDGNGNPPDPWESWQTDLAEKAQRAEDAAELLENPGAEATTLSPDSPATASYEDGTFHFGIPQGEQGEQGDPGYSPTATVSKSGKVTTVTVTDKNGTTTAQVEDGDDYVITDEDYDAIAGNVANRRAIQDKVDATESAANESRNWADGKNRDGSTNPLYSENNGEHYAGVAEAAAARAEAATVHQPITQNGTWWIWNQTTEQYEDTGEPSTGGSGGTTDYTDLTNKPSINNVELSGNKTLSQLGIPGQQEMVSAVDEWLDENITNPDSPPLDRSLTSDVSAAPADMVGEVKGTLSTLVVIEKEWLKESDASDGYYPSAAGTKSWSNTWACFGVVIPITEGVTYYYKDINPRWTWYRYENGTSNYLANNNNIASGTFIAQDDGTVVVTSGIGYEATAIFTDSYEIYQAGLQQDIIKPVTDSTLTEANLPANAKAVGDKFAEYDDTIGDITTVRKEWLKNSDFISGKYYANAEGTKSNGWACFDIEIPIEKGVTYYYKNINPRFSWYRYDDGTSNYFSNTNGIVNGSFYAMDSGTVIISSDSNSGSSAIFTDCIEIYDAGTQNDLIVTTALTTSNIHIVNGNYYQKYMTKSGYYQANGTIGGGGKHSDVPVASGETIKIFYKGATSIQTSQIPAVVFYADGVLDTVIQYNSLDKSYIDGQLVITVTVPDGCDTVGFNSMMASFDITETCVVCNADYDPANIKNVIDKLLNTELQDNYARDKISKLSGIKSVLQGKLVACLGDSITELNHWADKSWVTLLAEWTGCNVQNLGASGTGLTSENSKIANINPAVDIIGVAISFNDMTLLPTLGEVTDTGTSTYCGMANTFLDNLITAFPAVPIICYSQGPWGSYHKGVASSDARIDAIKTICANHGVPFYGELYENGCVLKPWIAENRDVYYTDSLGESNNIHPNSAGHTIIARALRKWFEQNVVDTHGTIWQ